MVDFADRLRLRRRAAVSGLVTREVLHIDAAQLEQKPDSLAALAEIRIETGWLAFATIVISPTRDVRELIPASVYTPRRELPSLAELETWSRQAPPTVMVVTADDAFLGSLRISRPAAAEPGSLSSQHGIDLVLVQPGSKERAIEIWTGGQHIADYSFLPRLGTWSVREFSRARDAVSAKVRAGPIVDTVLRKAVALSYHHGSTILLLASEDVPARLPFSARGERVGEDELGTALTMVTDEEFDGFGELDGAIVISMGGILECVRETLPNDPPTSVSRAEARALAKSRTLLQASARGTRHEGGLMASLHFPNSVVFCASQNRTVCAFVRGEAVVWDF